MLDWTSKKLSRRKGVQMAAKLMRIGKSRQIISASLVCCSSSNGLIFVIVPGESKEEKYYSEEKNEKAAKGEFKWSLPAEWLRMSGRLMRSKASRFKLQKRGLKRLRDKFSLAGMLHVVKTIRRGNGKRCSLETLPNWNGRLFMNERFFRASFAFGTCLLVRKNSAAKHLARVGAILSASPCY